MSRTGGITFHHPGLEPHQVEGESCVIDVANRGEHTLEEVSAVLGVTKERARQLEERALVALKLSEEPRRA